MTTRVKIINHGPKRIFTVPQRAFTPDASGAPFVGDAPEVTTIEVGGFAEITIDNGDPYCVVELEN